MQKNYRAVIIGGLLMGATGALRAQNVEKTMRRLPDTGQTQSFTATFGEDADYTVHAPFFENNGNGTITDTVTNLMWQQTDGGEMTFEAAAAYCDNLTLGGYDDWRLPSAQEAFSILNHGNNNPAINTAFFAPTGAEYWWTREIQVGNPAKIWVTNAGGGIGNHPKTETIGAGGTKKFHVRAVRDRVPPIVLTEQFTVTDSIVTDQLTQLEWLRWPPADSMTWEQALHVAETLVADGKSDWRLPNIKELESLNDESRSQPSVDPAVFPGILAKKYWSSTTLPNQSTRAWFMDTRFGVVSYDQKSVKNLVMCVRNASKSVVSGTNHTHLPAAPEIRVLPNPFSNFFTVEAAQTTPFELLTLTGRVVHTGTTGAQLHFSNLPGGVYLLRIGGEKPITFRLIKM